MASRIDKDEMVARGVKLASAVGLESNQSTSVLFGPCLFAVQS